MKHLQQVVVLMSIFALTTAGSVNPVFGQTLAIHGGMNRATLSGSDPDDEVNSRNGLKIGAAATVPVTDQFGLQLGLAYAQKGARLSADLEGDGDFEIEITGAALSTTIKLDYIEVSALGKVSVPLGESSASMHVLAGPVVAFNTKSEANVPIFGTVDLSEAVKGTDFGLAGGIGAEIPVSEGMTLSIAALYTLGLRSTAKDSDDEDLEWEGDVKNRALTVQIGLSFPMGN